MLPFGVKAYLSPWLLPPVSLFLLIAFGLLLGRHRPRAGRWVVAVGRCAGIALTMPLVPDRLMTWVEAPYAALDPPPQRLPKDRWVAWSAMPAGSRV